MISGRTTGWALRAMERAVVPVSVSVSIPSTVAFFFFLVPLFFFDSNGM
jgi:hypothetical protein